MKEHHDPQTHDLADGISRPGRRLTTHGHTFHPFLAPIKGEERTLAKTPQRKRTQSMKPTKIVIGSIAIAGALVLSACQGGGTPGTTTTPTASETATATPTPTPTATTVSAPTTEDQALKDGLGAVQKYETAMEEAANVKSLDTTQVKAVSTGPALKFAEDFVAASSKSATKYTGLSTVTLKEGSASNLTAGDQSFEFGFTDMSVCVDSSQVKGTRPDGSAAPTSEAPRALYQFTAEYNPTNKSWMVTNITQDAVVPC